MINTYSVLAQSLNRLYTDHRITLEHIKKLLRQNKINKDEYEFIIGKE